MASGTIILTNYKLYKAKIDAMSYGHGFMPAAFRDAGRAAGAKMEELVSQTLPPPVRKLPVAKYWTEKQKRWWWATMHEVAQGRRQMHGWKASYRRIDGRKVLVIQGGYRRTGRLVRSLNSQIVDSSEKGVTVAYGTQTIYSRWVLDEEKQSKYHVGNWTTLQELAKKFSPKVRKAFKDSLDKKIALYTKS